MENFKPRAFVPLFDLLVDPGEFQLLDDTIELLFIYIRYTSFCLVYSGKKYVSSTQNKGEIDV